MTRERREWIRQEISRRKFEQLYTIDSSGRRTMRGVYRNEFTSAARYGIPHGSTWSYKRYRCRCPECCAAITRASRKQWERRKAKARQPRES